MKDDIENKLRKLGPTGPPFEEHCPDFEILLAYYSSDLSAAERSKVRDHVLYCNTCAKELIALEDAARATAAHGTLSAFGHKMLTLVSTGFPGRHPVWSTGLAAAAICLLIVLIQPFGARMDHDTFRGRSTPEQFYALHPKGSVRSARSFSWGPVPDAQHYSVSLFDQDFTTIWSAKNIKQTSITLPPHLELKPDHSYSWLLTALRNSTIVHEESSPFVIRTGTR